MAVYNLLQFWTDTVLFWGLGALQAWAVIDCMTRRAAAFPAVDKLTKVAWLGILAASSLIGIWTRLPVGYGSPIGLISLISVVVAAVYLADVRPAVREVSDGKGR